MTRCISNPLLNKKKVDLYKKNAKIVLIVFLITMILCSVVAIAGSYDDPEKGDFKSGGIGYFAYSLYMLIYGNKLLSGVSSVLMLDTGSGAFKSLWTYIAKFYDTIQPVGMLLVLLYFLLEMIEKTQLDNLSPEHLIKLFIKFIVAIMLIGNGLDLLEKGIAFSNDIYSTVVDSSTPINDPNLQSLYNEIKDVGWIKAILYVVEAVFPAIVMLLCYVVIYAVSFGRMIEVCVRGVFAPIGMANIFEGGLNSTGYRYFKKFVAVCLQGAIIAVIIVAMNKINSNMSVDLFSSFGSFATPLLQMVVGLTAVMLIIKSQSWANDVLGV